MHVFSPTRCEMQMPRWTRQGVAEVAVCEKVAKEILM